MIARFDEVRERNFACGIPIFPVHVLSRGGLAVVADFSPQKLRSRLSSCLARAEVAVGVPGRTRRLYGFHSSRVGGYRRALASGLDRDLLRRRVAGRRKLPTVTGGMPS